MINGHKYISEAKHEEFALALIALIDEVEERDFDQVEALAEAIAQKARLRRLAAAADSIGIVAAARIAG